MVKKPSIEGRGLLQPEEFDIDELDYLETSNGHARKNSKDWSRQSRGRRGRWVRSKCICWTLVLVMALLVTGAALNRGGKLKIPSIPSRPLSSEKPTSTSLPDEPPAAVEPSTPTESSAEPESTTEPTSTESLETESTGSAAEPESTATDVVAEPEASDAVDSIPDTKPSIDVIDDTKHAKPEATSHANTTHEESPKNTSKDHNDTSHDSWTKPKGFKIIGLLFYGRPDTVGILDCYLKKNLVRNGGWLDEVHFVLNTDKKNDLKWLDKLVHKVDEYKKIDVGENRQVDGYNAGWMTCNKEDMYIKIDDDIVFFNDDAIPNLVFSLMKHPDALNVVSTLINSPETGWLHYRLGGTHAYLPERSRSKETLNDFESYGPKAWRASALPEWEGEEMEFEVAGVGMGKDDGYVKLPTDNPGAPPFKGHRWLPLPGGDKEIWRTPAARSEYNPNGPDWQSWSLGAQAHYSFLQNLENNATHLYHFGGGVDPKREGIWNMAYERMNINFMAIWGKDVAENLPFESFDDELALSVQVPLKLRRPLIVNTHAIAAHFHFRSQLEMYDTDLLDRYRAFANEMVCTKDNKIPVS